MYVVSRPSLDRVTLTDSKYGRGEHPDFVGPSPVHEFSLASWTQLCILRWYLDIGLGRGLKPGKYLHTAESVIERPGPDEFVWHTTNDTKTEPLSFHLIEHEAFLNFLDDGLLRPIEMDEGQLDVGHEWVCEPPSKEVIDLNALLEP